MRRAFRLIRQAPSAWRRFFFEPVSTMQITWIRILLGVTSFGWGLAIAPDLETFYFDGNLFTRPRYSGTRIGALRWLNEDWGAVVVLGVLLGASALLIIGRLVRIAAPLVFYGLMSLQQDITVLMNASDVLLRLWAFYFAVFALLTPSRFLRLGPRGPWPLGPRWILRVFQFQLTAIYIGTVIAKAPGSRWHNGTAAGIALGLEEFQRFWVPGFLRESLVASAIGTYIAFGLEITLPLLLWYRRTRILGVVLGVGMHLGFDYAMRLGYFFPGMLIGYVAFMRPGDIGRITTWIADPFRRAQPPDPAPPVDTGLTGEDDDPPILLDPELRSERTGAAEVLEV